jgi:hypothetical protein
MEKYLRQINYYLVIIEFSFRQAMKQIWMENKRIITLNQFKLFPIKLPLSKLIYIIKKYMLA